MRAVIQKLMRRLRPHPAVVAKRERRRVAVCAAETRARSDRTRAIETMLQLRRELGLPALPQFEPKESE